MIEQSPNIPELYIIGNPIETPIGTLHPVYVSEYPHFMQYSNILNLQDFQFKNIVLSTIKDKSLRGVIEPLIGDTHFFDILKSISNNDFSDDIDPFYIIYTEFKDTIQSDPLLDLYNHYKQLFEFCFKEDVFHKINTPEEFEYYRDLIREFNGIEFEKPNENPEIEKYNMLKRLLQEKESKLSFEGMYTSILVATGQDPSKMTLNQFNKTFVRIAQFKNFETTSIYKILDNEIDVVNWCDDVEKDDKKGVLTQQQLDNARKGLKDKNI